MMGALTSFTSGISFSSMGSFVQAMMARDADVGFYFTVLLDNIPAGDFVGIDGMGRSIEPYEYKELGKNDAPHVLVGQGKNNQITLKWGLMNRQVLYDWVQAVKPSGSFRKDVIVMQLSRQKLPIRIYTISGAWPVEWKAAPLSSLDSNMCVEEVTLVYDSIEMLAIPLPF